MRIGTQRTIYEYLCHELISNERKRFGVSVDRNQFAHFSDDRNELDNLIEMSAGFVLLLSKFKC